MSVHIIIVHICIVFLFPDVVLQVFAACFGSLLLNRGALCFPATRQTPVSPSMYHGNHTLNIVILLQALMNTLAIIVLVF